MRIEKTQTAILIVMQQASAIDNQYPIGKFTRVSELTREQREQAIDEIAELPRKLREAVAGLSDQQLDTPYRTGGWTVRQVVHHLADSHIHSYVRYRLALTESEPSIVTYQEGRWAELEDARTAPVDLSLALIESLHARWTILHRSMSDTDFAKMFTHPERGTVRLDGTAALYAWHGKHHVAQIQGLRERMGWR
jgi:uncharacterized damage-inducible protein DinB